MRNHCGDCQHNAKSRLVYPCNVCGGDPDTFFNEAKPRMKCMVPGCVNIQGEVRGHKIRVESEMGEIREGFICNPCFSFMRTGEGVFCALAKNGRKKPKSMKG